MCRSYLSSIFELIYERSYGHCFLSGIFKKTVRGNTPLQYVAQYPDGTSIPTLKTKTQFLRRPFQLSVNEVFRMKAEHFSFKMEVLAS